MLRTFYKTAHKTAKKKLKIHLTHETNSENMCALFTRPIIPNRLATYESAGMNRKKKKHIHEKGVKKTLSTKILGFWVSLHVNCDINRRRIGQTTKRMFLRGTRGV